VLSYAEISLSFKNHREEKTLKGIARVWDYLSKRGVSREIADSCGLHVLPAVELIAAARRSPNVNQADDRAAVVFPHFRYGDRDSVLDWWSARLVQTVDKAVRLATSFGDYVDPAKARTLGKMFCPPNEPPRAYLPPVYDWAKLRDGDTVYIHESCIKAINGARLGKPSVGLNGVWGWSSKKHGVALVEELRDLPWRAKKLQPVILFDSNAEDNWHVQEAENQLAAKLMEITGRQAVALHVPKPAEGGDQGFDDYAVAVGDAAALAFLEDESLRLPIDISEYNRMMVQLNTEVCVVRELGRIADQATGDLMTRATFTDVNYAHFVYTGEEDRQINVPRLWLSSLSRVEVQSLEYSPGESRVVRGNLNVWRGMGAEPEPGDVEPWLELLMNNVKDEDLQQWITAWCAYPLQNLGKKMAAYLLMFGPSGTGKNLFFKPFHSIYGGNAVILDTDAMKSQFTSFYAQRQFVHADELVRARGEEDAVSQRVKAMVTQEKIKVNKKGQPEYDVDNHLNLAITSNYWDCIKLDADDRRACVIRWGPGAVDRRGDQAYWQRYVRWAESGWGPAALYHYLLNLDISWFDPSAWAPHTVWKQEVKAATMSPMEQWALDLLEDPETVLPLPGKDKALWTAKELAGVYYGESEAELSPGKVKSLANVLRNVGFRQAHEGKLVKRPRTGVPERFWIIQQRDKAWGSAEINAYLKRW
jgi:hypothetical protein